MRAAPIVATVLCCLVTVAACGGDNTAPTPGTSSTPPPITDVGLCITADDATLLRHEGEVDAAVAIMGDGEAGVVISYEQNGSVCPWLPLAEQLVSAGYTVLLYDRLSEATYEFVPEMVALLRERGVADVALVGGSIGGMASIDAATNVEPAVAAVVSLSGADSGTVQAARDLTVPLLQIVAEGDTSFVGPAQSTDDAATGSPDHQLDIVSGSAHGSLFSVDAAIRDRVEEFLLSISPRSGQARRNSGARRWTTSHTGGMDQVQQIVQLVDDVLGPNALGTYLHGSAVHGGLKPASDVDVLVVSRISMEGGARQALVDRLLPISGWRAGARSVELTVVVQSEVRPWRFPPTGDFLYGDWLRADIGANGPPQPEPMPGLAFVIALALAGNHPLSGPPPDELLDPVPPADLVRGSLAGMAGLLDDLPSDARNVVLTFARIWGTLATGAILSKDTAADWALERLPAEHRPVLEHAKQLYLTCPYSEETWTEHLSTRVRPHVDAVLAEIAKIAAR